MPDNQSNNKRIAKNTLLLYFRMLLTMVISLYTSRVVLNTLGVEDFGIYNVVGGIVAMFGFVNAAMGSSTARFLTFALGENEQSKLRKTFSVSFTIHFLIAILIVLLAETAGLWFFKTNMQIPIGRVDAAMWVFQFSVLAAVLSILIVPFNAFIIAHEKMSAFAYISIADVILKLAIVYVLQIAPIDKLIMYSILLFGVQIINWGLYVAYCKRHFLETNIRLLYDKTLFRDMASFAGWSLIGNLAYVTYTQGLNMLLNMVFGPVVNAARGIAVQVQMAVYNFVNNFQTAINPQLVKSYAAGEIEYQRNLICYSSKISFFLLCVLAMPVFLETPYILKIWLVQVPEHTINFVRIMLFVSLIDTLSVPISFSIGATGNVKSSNIIISIILLLILPSSYLFLKLGFPPEAVFLTHFSFAAVAQIARVLILKSLTGFSIRYYSKTVILPTGLVLLILSFVALQIVTLFPERNFSNLIIVSLLSVSASLSIIYFIGLGTYERTMLKDFICKYLHKLKHS